MSFSCEVICDSKSEIGNHRLTTVKSTFPRYLLAEFNTHKMISKNSASSRAIPGKKLRESVRNSPYIPEQWMLDHKGMQGSEFITNLEQIRDVKADWWSAMQAALTYSEKLNDFRKISKQIANRLIEPFMHHTALMSATEWENFFALRAEGGAEINFQKTAYMILDAMNASEPKQLKAGEWHLPYGDIDRAKFTESFPEFQTMELSEFFSKQIKYQLKIATARCAGTSYVVVGEDGKEETYEKLIDRHDNKLVKFGHWSPMEHPGRSMNEFEYVNNTKTFTIPIAYFDEYRTNNDSRTYKASPIYSHTDDVVITEYGWCGNYRGFIQYRKMFANENRRDSRLIKK